ncbi:SusC/RagA family TonB-linked outer membrane protein, partial [Bacteroides heparinolyticus]
GTQIGTITGVDGDFTLPNVPSSAKTLQISFIGMQTQEVAIKPNVRVVMKAEAEQLEEVMVVAYGTAKKSSFTGSASTVSSKSIEKLQVSNVSRALEGAAPGVQVAMQSGQPGESATVRIRGIGSINSSAAPLYVVDGMPYNGSISAINPSDIESISVLKDAASTSLYGSRAANGVVVITTKKGNSQKSKVTLDARMGINSRGIPEYDIMKSPGEYMTTYWTVLKNQLGSGEKASAGLFGKLGYNPYDTDNGAIVDTNGNLTSAKLLYQDDWEKEAISNGTRQEYTLTVQGGSDKSTHFLSLGYLDDEGIISNSDYTRLSLRASGDYTVNEFIKLNGSVAYARGEQNSQAISNLSNYVNTFMFTQYVAPIYPVYAYDGKGTPVYNEDGSRRYDFGDGTYGNRAWGSNQNVVASDAANQNQIISDNVSSRFGVNITFLKDFKFSGNMGYDMTNQMQNRFMTPSFGDAAASGGRGYKYRTRSQTYTINELLNYTKEIAGKHHLDILVGHENYKYMYNYLYNAKTKFFDDLVPEYSNAITMEDMNSYSNEYTIESYLGRLNYDYDDKYYFSGSLRRDGSSRFAKDNRWGTFWSLGGSWRISKETFMENVSWISNLTLRASYGSVGNDDIYYPTTTTSNYYAYKTQYSVSNSDGSFAVSKYYHGNPDLTWETSYNFNVGLSASLWDNLLNIDFEYFNKKTEDMLYNVPQPMSSGLSYISKNALTMTNKGFEFTLGINIPMPRDMKWNWTLTGTHYKNKVTDIPEDKREAGITHSTYYNIREGKSVYDFYYYRYAGLDEKGHSLWYRDSKDKEGNITLETTDDYSKATKYYIGTALPDFQGGISTEFSWKGLDFSIAANYQLGGKIYDSMYASLMHAGSDAGRNWHQDIRNAWSETNTTSNIPVLNGNQNANTFSDRFLISATFFNIRNITLGYTFPKSWLKPAAIENARIYFAADNVALWSKRKGMDPRQYIYGQSQANYSAIRSISVGLSLTF